MKFKGHGIVWDKENNKPLVKFEDGEAEVKDKRAQGILKELEFEHGEEDTKNEDEEKSDNKDDENGEGQAKQGNQKGQKAQSKQKK